MLDKAGNYEALKKATNKIRNTFLIYIRETKLPLFVCDYERTLREQVRVQYQK